LNEIDSEICIILETAITLLLMKKILSKMLPILIKKEKPLLNKDFSITNSIVKKIAKTHFPPQKGIH
jgi:hypothetical protein